MLADTDSIRALAGSFRERAAELRDEAARLDTSATDVAWDGLSADAVRERAHERTAALRRTADLHEDAAEALDRHAAEVDRMLGLVGSALDVVDSLTRLIP
jgi:hypothetical protein